MSTIQMRGHLCTRRGEQVIFDHLFYLMECRSVIPLATPLMEISLMGGTSQHSKMRLTTATTPMTRLALEMLKLALTLLSRALLLPTTVKSVRLSTRLLPEFFTLFLGKLSPTF